MAENANGGEAPDVAPPASLGRLSPSRASDFMTCPLLYRYRSIDRLPEPASPSMAKGTLVHLVLERLFDVDAKERTMQLGHDLVAQAWQDLEGRPEYVDLLPGLNHEQWLADAKDLVTRYFHMEDPREVNPHQREAPVEFQIADDLVLRGLVDRLDIDTDGQSIIIDYKTGKAPSPQYEQKAMFQMRFYALVIWRSTGILPKSLRLMYLADGQALVDSPTGDDLMAMQRKVLALWDAIKTSTQAAEFRARPSVLCKWCHFTSICPAHEGTPLPFPQPRT